MYNKTNYNKKHDINTEPETWERVTMLPRKMKNIQNNLLGKRLNCPKIIHAGEEFPVTKPRTPWHESKLPNFTT